MLLLQKRRKIKREKKKKNRSNFCCYTEGLSNWPIRGPEIFSLTKERREISRLIYLKGLFTMLRKNEKPSLPFSPFFGLAMMHPFFILYPFNLRGTCIQERNECQVFHATSLRFPHARFTCRFFALRRTYSYEISTWVRKGKEKEAFY